MRRPSSRLIHGRFLAFRVDVAFSVESRPTQLGSLSSSRSSNPLERDRRIVRKTNTYCTIAKGYSIDLFAVVSHRNLLDSHSSNSNLDVRIDALESLLRSVRDLETNVTVFLNDGTRWPNPELVSVFSFD